MSSINTKVLVASAIAIAVIAMLAGAVIASSMWFRSPMMGIPGPQNIQAPQWWGWINQQGWQGCPGMAGGMMGGMMGWMQCPMMGFQQPYYVNDTNIAEYLRRYIAQSYGWAKLEIRSIEKYSNNYYVIIWDRDRNIGALELIVLPNGFIHPEMQSMMWNTLYGHHGIGYRGNEIGIERAREIAEHWLKTNMPGSILEEEYIFPGYYTFHFKTPSGDMQMLSVNAYTGYVLFHSWHGRYLGAVYEAET